ncbi:MAG: DNA-3-methyladenine glycosylase 2 family protein [Deltaproteobacteria bacterium]|nr:DNA-3-methyladenine glycosylase 2 family protein [Deltaproteobacteria bacterium]
MRKPVSITRLTPARKAAAVRHLRRADAKLARVIAAVGTCQLTVRDGNAYRSLFRAVLYQQLAGNAAAAIERRVQALFGGRVPAPAQLLAASDEALRAAGLSRQKTVYLRDLAARFDSGALSVRRLAALPDAEVVAAVTTVKGIGEWTAHMLLLFGLGRPDVLPVGDYGVRKAAQQLYQLDDLPRPHTLEQIAAPWRPYRSVASWYLWRMLDTEVLL